MQCMPIHVLIGRGPRAPMTRECIPILFKLNSRNPNHFLNLAPSISYSAGGEGGGAEIKQVLGLVPETHTRNPGPRPLNSV